MAIVKMKHLRLAAMREDRETLLKRLQSMGCVEVKEAHIDASDPIFSRLSSMESEGLAQAREQKNQAEYALTVLKRHAPEKSPLLAPKPSLTEQELLDEAAAQRARTQTQEINAAQRRLDGIRAQVEKIHAQIGTLMPWKQLDIPLETASTQQVTVQLGMLPAAAALEELTREITALGDLTELTVASSDREQHYVLLVSHVSQAPQVLELLKERGWSRANLKEWTGTAADNIAALEQQLKQLDQERQTIETKLASMGACRSAIEQWSDRNEVQERQEQFGSKLLESSQVFFLDGWIPEEACGALEQALASYTVALELTDPTPEEYAQVPVQLKNNWFTRPLNMVTDMYSLPAYGSLDPNPLMAPFFILFYGFMMADMGYGLVMMLASWIIMKKAKPDGPTMRHMIPLMGLCGVSTFIMGMLTGGFFGDLLPQLAMMLNPDTTFTSMPALFSPLDDALAVLIGSLAIGVVQIFTGMGVSMYRKIKQGQMMDALCNEGAWYLVFILLAGGILLGQVTPALIAILVVLVLTQGYGKKGIVGKLTGIFGSLYNNITGYFSDILSYSRLMALMLAGAVIAQVFNTLGALTGNVVLFFLISMVGNALNFILNLLGCYVHDMRLQCLEYFGRFYEDGGKPFQPLNLKTKYYRIVK